MNCAHNCTSQVTKLLASKPSYRRDFKRLEEVLKRGKPVGTNLRRHGFGYLVNLWYATAHRECEREGFTSLTEFALYVGPRPTPRHQLHRLENNRPYERGNVQWEPQSRGSVQSLVKSNTRPHRWGGKRLSHAELAAAIEARGGGHATEAGVAKMTQRYRRKMPGAEVTEAIVKRHGLPFERSSRPLENWDFPEAMGKARYAYAQYHNGETRLDFAIGWTEERAAEAVACADDERADAGTRELYRRLAKGLSAEVADLESKRAALLRLEAEQKVIDAGLKFRDISPATPKRDPVQAGLFDEPRELPGLEAQEAAERYPTLEEAIEHVLPGHQGLAAEIRDTCEAAHRAGLPHPYKHHPYYRFPDEGPPSGTLEAARRALKENAGN